MGLSMLQKNMIKMGVDQLHKWLVREKAGKFKLSLSTINTWLSENEYPFSISVSIESENNVMATNVELNCK